MTDTAGFEHSEDQMWIAAADGVVYVVQQDSAVCGMLRRLLKSAALTVHGLASAMRSSGRRGSRSRSGPAA